MSETRFDFEMGPHDHDEERAGEIDGNGRGPRAGGIQLILHEGDQLLHAQRIRPGRGRHDDRLGQGGEDEIAAGLVELQAAADELRLGLGTVFDFTRTAPFDRPWMPNGPAAFQGVDAPWITCGLPCGSTATSPAARPIERSGAVRWRVQLPSVTMWKGAQAWGSAACSEAHCAPKRQVYCTSGRTRSRGAKPLRVSDARGSAMWSLFKGWMIPCGTSLSRAGISVVAGQP